MDKEIVKHCEKCGPLTADKAYIWYAKSGKRIGQKKVECRKCNLENCSLRNVKNPEKAKLHRDKYRNAERDINIQELKCSKCQRIKNISLFNEHMLKLRYPYCRDCRIAATKNHHDKDESKKKHKKWYQAVYEPIAKNAYYLKRYNISFDEYTEMNEKQNSLCLICNQPEGVSTRKDKTVHLHVDHCHKTGKVRGLLCRLCNTALGSLRHSPELLVKAAEYLKSHQS